MMLCKAWSILLHILLVQRTYVHALPGKPYFPCNLFKWRCKEVPATYVPATSAADVPPTIAYAKWYPEHYGRLLAQIPEQLSQLPEYQEVHTGVVAKQASHHDMQLASWSES
ncbi:hypothetical protein [Sporisorium scitamineum]|uniref:Uncharacterized protein n=1 Tax=Sporisorium scitamineum TaxID=49012 RepID=A0A0F7RXA5_9BASI|nr:hypothetical protein [Sporisorium scitamineum]